MNPEGPEHVNIVANDAKMVAKVPKLLTNLVAKYDVNLDLSPRSRQVPIEPPLTATAGSDVVQSGRLIFDDFSQHLWPYIGNNTANVVFQMVKHLWLIRIDQ
ncbi:hypothetical protein TNCV_1535271 [Trichonephila clavipes]|uniref:Uncharacterized protein n=1 Tax=Trichonephila clavipes TaxID=2585209 RepID=A0A8X6RG94_TRICX|nr:hypothetical protein TNCV_1535271 [Trichonephila clavipes]